MNKSIFILTICLLVTKCVLAQKEGQPLADSLEQVLKQKDLTGTRKVDVLTKLSYEYRNLLPRKAILFGEQAEQLAKEIHYEKKLGEIYICQSLAFAFFNDVIKGYEMALRALKYNVDYGMNDLIPYSRQMVATTNPNLPSAAQLDSLREILKDVNKIKDKEWYIKSIGGIGNGFRIIGDERESDSLVSLAMEESRKSGYRFLEIHNMVRMSTSLANKTQYDTAISLIRYVNTYLESIGEKRIRSENLRTMATVNLEMYLKSKQPALLDSAQKYADLALEKSAEIEYQGEILFGYNLEYLISNERHDTDMALGYLQKYVALNDSVYGQKAREKLEGIAIRQQNEIAEAQLKVKDAEVVRQRMYTYSGLAGIGLSALLLFFVYRNYKNQRKSTAIILSEKQRSEELLLNILPAEMAEELKATGTTKAKAFTMVTVMFTDFKDFTSISERVSAELLVDEIHHCFSAFDRILQKYKIEKIKTIGDAYMCASGLPVPNYTHATDMLQAALEIMDYMNQRRKEKESKGEIPFLLRIGIHTGPVVAGIVGVKKFAYDIWGDTVNLAARMEQHSEAGKINISGSTYELVKDKFRCEYRGKINAKNKGEVDMYFADRLEK